ncbi:M13 family metallopeptidase [Crocosphaera sp. XPORK-15E]|uniref:M13 family metallopeptidase n=1 Tax=Crocosphaera sp. XPORK-15E TaxID=3110247 RepID=UPI002B1F63FF|nr:M13 family metallopeptidase [Crocosphaera sp. XPORK-15E]MEA5535681.1 M13 family metallopeptidase [Crocosphaera sp. XPORK-15E]
MMKSIAHISLVTMTAIALLGSQPEYASSQSTDSTLSKAEPSQQGFSVNHMDLSVEPQKNFYQFAAGNWLKKAVIPDDKPSVSSFDELDEQNNQKIQKIIKEAQAKSSQSPKGSITQQVGDFYTAGMNTELLEKLGATPLKSELNKVKTLTSKKDLIPLLAHQNLIGVSSIVDQYVAPDKKQATVNALYLSPATLPVSNREFYLSPNFEPQRKAYLTHIAKMLSLIGENPSQAEAQAKTILEMETALAKVTLSPTEARDVDKVYNKFTLAQLQKSYPNFDWQQYFSLLGLTDVKEVIVEEPRYYEKVNVLLKERSLEDWKTYQRWQYLTAKAVYLNDDFLQEKFDFFGKTMFGVTALPPRNRIITDTLLSSLNPPISQLFVKQYFPPATKAKTEIMVANIKAEFKRRLEQNPWMSEATRQKAIAKLDKMKILVGYPEKWLDYSAIEIKADDYFGNHTRLTEWKNRYNLAKLKQPVVTEYFVLNGTFPTQVNAAYVPSSNSIQIPAGILQPPFFDAKLDNAVNYCSIGAVIAHEFTHGFDDKGRLFDGDGNRKDWWTKEDGENFSQRANQLVKQYNQYEVLPGLFVNGQLTLGENIADLGGITIALSALKRSLTAEKLATKIDGFTPEQRCFIAWGQLWKTKDRPEIVRQLVQTNPHPPSEFRVTGPLVNVPEFFPTFSIKKGDPLWRDPAERVTIW